MIPTTTGGIAHGTSASERASQRPCRSWLSSSASPSASTNWIAVTVTAQIRPILNALMKRVVVKQLAEVVEPDEVGLRHRARPVSP